MAYAIHCCESRAGLADPRQDRPSNQILRAGSDKSAGGATVRKRLDAGVVGHCAGKIF